MEGLDNGAAAVAPTAIPGASLEGDDLTKIRGIGEDTAKKLNAAGVVSYRQLANLNISDCEHLEDETGLKGRITNFYWRDQARKLIAEPPRLRPSRAAGQAEIPRPPELDEDDGGEPEEEESVLADPVDDAATQVEVLRRQLDDLQRQMSRRIAASGTRRSRVVPIAAEGKMRRRLNKNRKYSDIMGVDPNVPPGTLFQQIVTEDGEKRVAYFANDEIQRFLSDDDADDIDFDNVEPEHEINIDTVNARHYLNGRADYPFPLMQAWMKERFSFEARSPKDIKEELHRMINTNRS